MLSLADSIFLFLLFNHISFLSKTPMSLNLLPPGHTSYSSRMKLLPWTEFRCEVWKVCFYCFDFTLTFSLIWERVFVFESRFFMIELFVQLYNFIVPYKELMERGGW
mmetsp:Transcript_18594/g.17689  ORF Transcript_18594/g.17689 Transcript_18594/m.17689 type:complete len:107 (+) Transcript_18594:1297-1617(+)